MIVVSWQTLFPRTGNPNELGSTSFGNAEALCDLHRVLALAEICEAGLGQAGLIEIGGYGYRVHTALHGSECCTVHGVYVRIELAGERPREDERTPPAFASTGQGDPRSELVSEIPLSRN